uniref:electron transport complex subunit RsxG n=1 Tax=Ningiella ruwaisensis TaxID=2364274 RepID=UPI0010A02704|nr:electron transport complex subunit RsxG [Ningiella ruwaisensis]
MWTFISRNGLILAGFAVVSTGLIAMTFYATKDEIAAAQEKQLLSVLNELVPHDKHSNELHTDCIIVKADPLLGNQPQRIFRARQNGDNYAAIVETTAPDGYSGDIELVVAVDTNLNSLGARVIAHRETPGLGDKIDLRISDWIKSFTDVSYSEETRSRWQVKKDGGQFDQFTGATITPRAVVNAVKNAIIYVELHGQSIFESPSSCGAPDTLVTPDIASTGSQTNNHTNGRYQ